MVHLGILPSRRFVRIKHSGQRSTRKQTWRVATSDTISVTGPTHRDYYDVFPALENSPGDIWTDLPTHGLLPIPRLAGLIITPACDLANRKVDAVTYLPVIPIRAFFSIVSVLPDVRRTIDGHWKLVSESKLCDWPKGFCLPKIEQLIASDEAVLQATTAARSNKVKAALARVTAGMRVVRTIASPSVVEIDNSDLKAMFGEGEWSRIVERIIKNAYRQDFHFLPRDEQTADWSAVPKHSVVLFRYPITVPFEILEAAQDVTLGDWNACLQEHKNAHPMAPAFEGNRPMKRARLRIPFISDLITRYTAINLRLGSPDFTTEAVDRMGGEI